jgi:predicted anti-sigma-YlaC factor YlaD
MSEKTEAALAIVAALLVLFSAMLDPRISAGLAVVLLVAFAIFKFVRKV